MYLQFLMKVSSRTKFRENCILQKPANWLASSIFHNFSQEGNSQKTIDFYRKTTSHKIHNSDKTYFENHDEA